MVKFSSQSYEGGGDEMEAVIKESKGLDGVVIGEVEKPKLRPGYAVVKILAAGICGTDLHIASDEYGYEPPVVMGHEIYGVVVEIASDQQERTAYLGQRVVCETYFSTCGLCDMCRAGRINLCKARRSIGSFENGGFAEYVLVPSKNLHLVPDSIGGVEAALCEPLACITQCLCDPGIVQPGDKVLVTGPGTMGQLACQVARAAGAQVLLAGLEKDSNRLAVANGLGFDTTTSAGDEATFDVVIECSGHESAAAGALQAVRRGGKYVQVGIHGKLAALPIDQVLYKEVTLTSGFASTPTSWKRALRLVESKSVTLEPLVTRKVGIQEFKSALSDVANGRGIKTVVVPTT